jgi:hypothetical protein
MILSALGFYSITQTLFLKLKSAQEDNQAIHAALEKIRIDLLQAGCGLVQPVRLGAVEGIVPTGAALTIYRMDQAYSLLEDLYSGEKQIALESAQGIGAGREACLADSEKAEIVEISSFAGNTILLSRPLGSSYLMKDSRVLLLEKVTYFLDEKSATIRRKVNASSPQPLLDEAAFFEFEYTKEEALVYLSLALKTGEEKKHEIWVLPKNLRLAHVEH